MACHSSSKEENYPKERTTKLTLEIDKIDEQTTKIYIKTSVFYKIFGKNLYISVISQNVNKGITVTV